MDKSKIIKTVVFLAAIAIAAGGFLRMLQKNSMSLAEYEKLNGTESESADYSSTPADGNNGNDDGDSKNDTGTDGTNAERDDGNDDRDSKSDTDSTDVEDNIRDDDADRDDSGSNGEGKNDRAENLQNPTETMTPVSLLTGASLNGSSQLEDRVTYEEGFYYEPISDELRRYMTGISYPSTRTPSNGADPAEDASGTASSADVKITLDELRYVHILHYDFDGNPAEGELICNEYIAQDLVEIFYELYNNEYRLEKVLLIDEYDGNDTASMEDNNTSCFNYRTVPGKSSLSKHSYGLAIDINPLYNPYITYNKDGTRNVSPASGESYADRTLYFPYKIDEEDLCYKLFIQHGFTWGGSWNHSKDYQHFQKAKP